MHANIKDVLSHVVTQYDLHTLEGTAFLGEPNINFQLNRYLDLIEVLKKFGHDTSAAEIGFWSKYAEIQDTAFQDPASKALADKNVVRLHLLHERTEAALSIARSIMALNTPQTESEMMRQFSINQVHQAKIDALLEIAEYYAKLGQVETAYRLAQEARFAGDKHVFVEVYAVLAQHFRSLGQLDKLNELVEELENYVSLLRQLFTSDSMYELIINIILDRVEEIRNEAETSEKGERKSSFALWKVDPSFNLQPQELHERLKNEAQEIKKTEDLGITQRRIADVVVSMCHHLDSNDDWQKNSIILYDLLEQAAQAYFTQVSVVMNQDGKLENQVVLERQGNWSNVLIDPSKPAPSNQHYVVTKMQMAYTAAKFSDFELLQKILDNHFSLNEVVHLYKRTAFQELQSNLSA